MTGRALRITSRVVFLLCGLISIFPALPYAVMRGEDLPVESEWIVFVIALGVIGGFSVVVALLPSSWLAKPFNMQWDDKKLYATPFKLLGLFAPIGYLVAVFAYLTPSTWNLNPQLMLILCPMYLVKLTFDPSPVATFCLLAPMNAALFGALGLTLAFARLLFRRAR